LPICERFKENNPKLFELLDELHDEYMFFDLDQDRKDIISFVSGEIREFKEENLSKNRDVYTLVSQFKITVVFYLDKMI
jgi:hypothetical protein